MISIENSFVVHELELSKSDAEEVATLIGEKYSNSGLADFPKTKDLCTYTML